MDTLAALALATEKPTTQLLKRKPINVMRSRILSNKMLKHIAGQATYQTAVLLILLYLGPTIFSREVRSDEHYTLIFNSFVWCQIFNEFNARRVNDEFNVFTNLHTSYIFIGVIFFTVLFQTLIVEFGGVVFHTHSLYWYEWLACVGIGSGSLVVRVILWAIPVPEDKEYVPDGDDKKDDDDDKKTKKEEKQQKYL